MPGQPLFDLAWQVREKPVPHPLSRRRGETHGRSLSIYDLSEKETGGLALNRLKDRWPGDEEIKTKEKACA